MFKNVLTGRTRYRTDRRGRFILQAEYEYTHFGHSPVDIERRKDWRDVNAEIYTMLELKAPTSALQEKPHD